MFPMGNCVFATSLLLLHIDLKQLHHLMRHVEIHSFFPKKLPISGTFIWQTFVTLLEWLHSGFS